MSDTSPAVLRLRRSLALVIAGLLIQLLCTLWWSPAAFILFAVFGVGLVLLGVGWFLFSAWRHIDSHVAQTLAAQEPKERV